MREEGRGPNNLRREIGGTGEVTLRLPLLHLSLECGEEEIGIGSGRGEGTGGLDSRIDTI